jgi:hypothetical protein
MASPKRLDRPATIDVRAKPSFQTEPQIARRLDIPREASGIEDFYASVSSREALQLAGYEWQHRAAVGAGIRAWGALIVFWATIVLMLALWAAG